MQERQEISDIPVADATETPEPWALSHQPQGSLFTQPDEPDLARADPDILETLEGIVGHDKGEVGVRDHNVPQVDLLQDP